MRRTVEPFRKRRDEIPLPAGGNCFTGIEECGRGVIAEHRKQVAEHVTGTAVVMMRIQVPGIRAGVLMIVTIPALRVVKRQHIMAMRRLSRGRLPTEGRREHGRQQDGEHCRSNESGGAAHGRILPHKNQWPRALRIAITSIGARRHANSLPLRPAFTSKTYRSRRIS